MRSYLTIPAAMALSLSLTAPATSVWAQTTPAMPQSEQNHSAHHPSGDQSADPKGDPQSEQGGMMGMMGGQPGAQPGGGMMGGDMARMMSMMAMMHGGGMVGMPFDHVEGRLAFLKTELKITPDQEPHWNKLADAVRSVAQSLKGMRQEMMEGGQMMQASAQSAPARLERYESMLSARLEAVRTVKAAFDPLYALLSDEQKKMADELFGNPVGVM